MRVAELVGTLSLATDAGTGMADETGLRVAAVAAKVGALIAVSPADRAPSRRHSARGNPHFTDPS